MQAAGVQRNREGAGGGFSSGLPPFLWTDLSQIKKGHSGPTNSCLGPCRLLRWGRELSAPHLLRKSSNSKTVSPLASGPAQCIVGYRGRASKGWASIPRHSSSPGGSWTGFNSGPPARRSGQGRRMGSSHRMGETVRAGKERLAGWPGHLLTSGWESQCFSLSLA